LRVENRDELLLKLLHEREPLYAALADFRVLTDDRSVTAVAQDILNWIKS